MREAAERRNCKGCLTPLNFFQILSQKLADSGIAVPSEPDMPLSNTVIPGAADLTSTTSDSSTSHSARRADYEGSTRIDSSRM